MNVIEYSIRLGAALGKTETGKYMKNVYNALQMKYGKNDASKEGAFFSTYNQCAEAECSRHHFYGWISVYDKFVLYTKSKKDEQDALLINTARFVIDCQEIRLVNNEAKRMGDLVENIANGLISGKYDNPAIDEIMKIYKVKNAIKDLQMAVDRTGLKLFVAKKAKFILQEKPKICDQFEKQLRMTNYVPYIGEVCPIEQPKDISKEYVDVLQRLIFLNYVVGMGIFEGFWNTVLSVESQNIISDVPAVVEYISRISFTHNQVNELFCKESWIYTILRPEGKVYVLANRRTMQFEMGTIKTEVAGICYPYEDCGLFEKDIIVK